MTQYNCHLKKGELLQFVFKQFFVISCIVFIFILTACFEEFEEINMEAKQITLTGIPEEYNGKTIYLSLHPDEEQYSRSIFGEEIISDTSVIIPIKYSRDDWNGFGSFYLAFRIPVDSSIISTNNNHYEEFRYIERKYYIRDTNSIINFSDFYKHEEINLNAKKITINGIPEGYLGCRVHIRLNPNTPIDRNNFYVAGNISAASELIISGSVILSLMTGSPWRGSGSHYIAIIILISANNSEFFRYTDGRYNISETNTILNFSDFYKID